MQQSQYRNNFQNICSGNVARCLAGMVFIPVHGATKCSVGICGMPCKHRLMIDCLHSRDMCTPTHQLLPQTSSIIPVRIRNRQNKLVKSLKTLCKNNNFTAKTVNLVSIPCQLQSITKKETANTFNKLTLALLNIRSLAGKSFLNQ